MPYSASILTAAQALLSCLPCAAYRRAPPMVRDLCLPLTPLPCAWFSCLDPSISVGLALPTWHACHRTLCAFIAVKRCRRAHRTWARGTFCKAYSTLVLRGWLPADQFVLCACGLPFNLPLTPPSSIALSLLHTSLILRALHGNTHCYLHYHCLPYARLNVHTPRHSMSPVSRRLGSLRAYCLRNMLVLRRVQRLPRLPLPPPDGRGTCGRALVPPSATGAGAPGAATARQNMQQTRAKNADGLAENIACCYMPSGCIPPHAPRTLRTHYNSAMP